MALVFPSTRREYIQRQKEVYDRRVWGVFPARYPRELLWAMNVLPVEIWDPPVEIVNANAHLQPYICSVVKAGLELILQGKCDQVDGFFFPHTCDSIQNLASIVHDYLGLGKPCYFFYHPKGPYSDAAREHYLNQLQELARRLERQGLPLDGKELKYRVSQGREVASLLHEIYVKRASGKINASNEEFYRVLRQGEFLHPDDYTNILEEFLDARKGPSTQGPRVILTGILPSPPGVLRLLDELGVQVVDDDFMALSRRFHPPLETSLDPFQSLADSYFAMPPCSTKNSSIKDRLDHIVGKVKRSGAKGVIFYLIKFCEPELFDVPQLVDGLKREGLSTLVIDSELNEPQSGQLATRVEAFIEMME